MSPPNEQPGRISPLFMLLLIVAGLGIGFVIVLVVASVFGMHFG